MLAVIKHAANDDFCLSAKQLTKTAAHGAHNARGLSNGTIVSELQ